MHNVNDQGSILINAEVLTVSQRPLVSLFTASLKTHSMVPLAVLRDHLATKPPLDSSRATSERVEGSRHRQSRHEQQVAGADSVAGGDHCSGVRPRDVAREVQLQS